MLKTLMGAVWRNVPAKVRRWGVRLVEPRFTVTAGAVVLDREGRVLLLNHVFRTGSGWGIPGGFIEGGEQPEDALRRELREEAGLEVEEVKLISARTLKRPQQIELVYACRAANAPAPNSFEIKTAEWFAPDALPAGLPSDQKHVIRRAIEKQF
jgi:ADP-ribose pyrophosphatase YjhB (NUDIX family)